MLLHRIAACGPRLPRRLLLASSTSAAAAAAPRAMSTAAGGGGGGGGQPSAATAPEYGVVPLGDHGPFREYSVIHTDRSLNLMSAPFQRVMRDLSALLRHTYRAHRAVIVPGSGTFGMEAVARQFATDEHVLVIRNGWFSFRWTEIFELGGIPRSHTVLKALPVPGDQAEAEEENDPSRPQFAPHPVEAVVERIHRERPAVVFAPHVETSTGLLLPDDYIRRVAEAVHAVGGLFVLDCIASGTIWVDMQALGVDVLISAPQKGWSGPPCAALVQLSEAATEHMLAHSKDTSFSLSLKRWAAIMEAYDGGAFGYHTTMPTDALRDFHEISVETLRFGLPQLKAAQQAMGDRARAALDRRGLRSVAAPGFQAPGVLVYYSPDDAANPAMMQAFKAQGLQIAMGVPWRIDEPEGLKTFRIGLFGLDKLGNVDGTLAVMEEALDHVLEETGAAKKAA